MEDNQIYIENIGIGLLNISNLNNLDLKLNEYLVVGQRNNPNPSVTIDNQYNMIVNHNGVGINASRREMLDTNAGLLVNNNIICKGKIIANSIEFQNFSLNNDITNASLTSLINKVNSNLFFFNGYSNQGIINTIYTPNYLSIGNFTSTYDNAHPLKISETPSGKIKNIQFSIYNQGNNDLEQTKLSIGILGLSKNSPANIITTKGMPLEFHISKDSSKINDLYSNATGLPNYGNIIDNYPQMAIDTNGTVIINKNDCPITLTYDNISSKPKLYVNGSHYATNFFMYDKYTNTNLHLNDIYMSKTGITLNVNQLYGTNFLKTEFTFNSNINIGNSNDKYLLTVNDSLIVKNNLSTENLNANNTNFNGVAEFNGYTYFNNVTTFTDNISINRSLNIGNDLFIGGYRVYNSNINFSTNGINYDQESNLNISGRFGTGVLATDSYDNQFNIIKRKTERFEIYMNDISQLTTDGSKVYIGHSALKNINGNIDNSLIFLTQKNVKWHNIYFYAGKNKEGLNGFNVISPNLAIMENNKIGINTNLPERTLDIIGDMISNDYYIRLNSQTYKTNVIYLNNNKESVLKVNNLNINLTDNIDYINKKTVNLKGGINSYDGFFEGGIRIIGFTRDDTFNITYINDNIGIGVIKTNNNYPVPLQIRNTNTNNFNNSIIRLYRGLRGGSFNNDSLFTGIDFCDYDLPFSEQNRNNYKWFIYKNHTNQNNIAGVFQIGFTNNSINPTHSATNYYYDDINNKYHIDINNPIVDYNYDRNVAVSIKGNVDIKGNLNLIGENSTYNINGITIGSFSNPAVMRNSTSSIYNSPQGSTKNDISIVANKIGILPNKILAFAYNNDDWIYDKLKSIQESTTEDNNLSIFYNNKDYINTNTPPVISKFYNKSFKNYSSRPDIAIIEQGIVYNDTITGSVINKVDLILKGYDDITIYEITPNNKQPFITFINKNNHNQVNIGNKPFYQSNTIIYPNIACHIYDDFDCLLRLTNINKTVKLEMAYDTNIWSFNANEKFNLSYNSNNVINLTSNGEIVINKYDFIDDKNYIYNSTLNLNGIPNKSSIECTNFYYNNYKNTTETIEGQSGFIESHYSNIKPIFTTNYFDSYDDTKDKVISSFIYKIEDSNLPSVDINNQQLINYAVINSNHVIESNISIKFNFNIYNINLNYKYLDVNVNENSKTISLIPTLKSNDLNINAFIRTSNNISHTYTFGGDKELVLNYLLPQTPNANDLTLESSLIDSNWTSNYYENNYYNLNIRTFLKNKNNPNFNNYDIKSVINTFIINNNFYKTFNNIYYLPYTDVIINEIQVNLNYDYKYKNDITIPSNFFKNYNNNSIITLIDNSNAYINNSNTYLTNNIYSSYSELPVNIHQMEIICSNLSTDIYKKLYPIEINNLNLMNVELSINQKNFFDYYIFNTGFIYIPIPIIYNNYKPHLTLKNYINSRYSQPHHFYSYENKYEIHLGTSKLLTIDSNANLEASGDLKIKDIYFSGDIYNTTGGTLTSLINNYSGSNFYLEKANVSMNASNLFLNPSINNYGGIIINRGDIYNSNNLFEINNYYNNDNFITLKSVSDSGFINFSGTHNLFKLGSSNGNFGIWKTSDTTILNSTYLLNNLNNFSNVINFDYSLNTNRYPTINLNGAIRSTSNLSINDIDIYPNNDLNYKVRVYGNMKVDGSVMSSSDIRIKSEIKVIESALDKISKLKGITYKNNRNNNDNRETGLIAQEVKEVIPEAVFEDENGYLNIAYGNLMGLVIEALKEIKTLIH